MNKQKIFTGFLLLLTFQLVSCSSNIEIQKNSSDIIKKNEGPNNFSGKYNNLRTMFEILPDEEDEIVFLGNSIMEYCQWHELFENPKIRNRGIGGDGTEGLLFRLEEAVVSKPAKIFLMIGINDINKGMSIKDIAANIEKIISTVITESPDTKIYVHSVLPVNYKLFGNKIDNKNVIELNILLKGITNKYNLEYIDLFSRLASADNQLKEDYTFDGLHLNGKGYLTWKETIEKMVNN